MSKLFAAVAVAALMAGAAHAAPAKPAPQAIELGDFMGRLRSIKVKTAGGEEGLSVTLVWRVDRIRGATATSPAEVVLTRDDPSTPDRPPLTRVLVLHPEEASISGGVTAL